MIPILIYNKKDLSNPSVSNLDTLKVDKYSNADGTDSGSATPADAVAQAQAALSQFSNVYNKLVTLFEQTYQTIANTWRAQCIGDKKSALYLQGAQCYNTIMGGYDVAVEAKDDWYNVTCLDSANLTNAVTSIYNNIYQNNPFSPFVFPDGTYRFTIKGWAAAKPNLQAQLATLKQALTDATTAAQTTLTITTQQATAEAAQSQASTAKSQATSASITKYIVIGLAAVGVIVGSYFLLKKKKVPTIAK